MRKFILPILILASLACSLISPRATPTIVPSSTPTNTPVSPTQTAAPTPQSAPQSPSRPTMDRPATNDRLQRSPRGNSVTPSLADVTYCTMDGVELKMDFYYPVSAGSRWPVTMYVHGGGWSKGDKSEGAGSAEIPPLINAGFLVVAANYRLAPEHPFPAMIEDLKCAVRYLRAHADEYNLDPDRIGVWGGSAGGHLANLLGTTDESAGFDVGEYLEYSSRVQAVVDMFGPADLTVPFEGGYDGASRVFNGFDAALASPVTYVTSDDPPFLMLHGDSDKLVPIEQSQILLAALRAVGVTAELVVVTNAGHSFKPLEGMTIRPSRMEIARLVVAFFEAQFK